MNVGELKEWLEDFHDECEVRIAEQPHYPMEYSIRGVVDYNPDVDEDTDMSEVDATKDIIYITEGRQIGYCPRDVFEL